MPLYDYKCDCGYIISVTEPYESHSYHRELFCPECRKFEDFKWQFPLSRFQFGVFEAEVKNG